ncbi:MAG: hypothetical protein GY830_02180 [Bacteroidetes bacterium]|nr:hypothetical protein [Bacteroidota bacterium]
MRKFTKADIERILNYLTEGANNALKSAKQHGKDQVFHGSEFSGNVEDIPIDFFDIKILMISDNKQYAEKFNSDGVDIEVYSNSNSNLDKCFAYDIVAVEVTEKTADVKEIVKSLHHRSRDVLIAIISPFSEHKEMTVKAGGRFFLSPLDIRELEEWIAYLKNRK